MPHVCFYFGVFSETVDTSAVTWPRRKLLGKQEAAAEAGWVFIAHSELPVAYHFSSSCINPFSGLLPSMVG